MPQKWRGPIAFEGVETGDGRMMDLGALYWDDAPLALIWDRTDGDHTGETVGVVTRIWRENDVIYAEGEFSDSQEESAAAAVARAVELIREGGVGVSVALDNERAQIRVDVELLEEVEDVEEQTDSEGRIVVEEWGPNDSLYVVTSARIRHLAIVDTAAFAEAKIALLASAAVKRRGAPIIFDDLRIALTASVAVERFRDPEFGRDGDVDARLVWQDPERPEEPGGWGCPITITPDGHVYGHAALWNRCHAGFTDRCVTPPRGSDYSRFLSGEAVPGVATGPLTIATDHPDPFWLLTQAMAHYADTGVAVADVTIGEDRHGLWVSGSIRPGASENDVAALRGSVLSGDWRPFGYGHRLAGILAVNNGGFLVQRRTEALAASSGPNRAAVFTYGAHDCAPCRRRALLAANGFTGAVIAALPRASDAERLAVSGGDPVESLHVTLAWLGDAEEIDETGRTALVDELTAITQDQESVTADVFGYGVFNPTSDEAASVMLLQSTQLTQLRGLVAEQDVSDHPTWVPHLTLGYNLDDEPADRSDLTGEVVFDRVMLAFGDDVHIFNLGEDAEVEETDEDNSLAALERRLQVLEIAAGADLMRGISA